MQKTLLAIIGLIVLSSTVAYASYVGWGLPTQKDEFYIRQAAATAGRTVRGGSTRFGK